MRTRKPSVDLKGPASFYAAPDERIIEFSYVNNAGELRGGLISFAGSDANLTVDIYRCDPGVVVRVGPEIPQGQVLRPVS